MTAAPSDSGQCSCYVVTWQPAKIWAAFSDDWKKALDRNKLEYFKMREANSLRRQFSGWDNTERDKLLIALAQIIKRHVSLGITSALFYEDLERARMEYPDIAGEWKGRDQYQILFHGAIARLANYYINAKTKDRIQFIFDEQAVWGLQAIIETTALLPLLKPKERAIIAGPPIQRDDKDCLPLQAADMIAWQTRRFIVENATVDIESRLEDFKVNSPALKLLGTIPTIYNTYGVPRIRSILSAQRAMRKHAAFNFLRERG